MWATEADIPEVRRFLEAHVTGSMFPLVNLRDHGLNGDHDRSVNFWVLHEGDRITDVLTISQEGVVFPQCPLMNWAAIKPALRDRGIQGFIGARDQVRSLQKALGLDNANAFLNHDEPQFDLDLENLKVPDGPDHIIPIAKAPEDIIRAWMLDYQMNALHMAEMPARAAVENSYASYCSKQSHVVLMEGETPISMTGFNARLPDIVQIGGVYTPPELRGKGYARRAVALHLEQARNQGVTRATLFASGPSAVAAYKAIGFNQIGDWTLCLFNEVQYANV